jgi:small subunit ribosomal protein S9
MKQAITSYHGVGRRKSSVARVWMKNGKGAITVNGKDIKEYFDTETARTAARRALDVTNLGSQFDVKVTVLGGGLTGQSDAVKLGVARALLVADESLRPTLRQNNLLTVDARVKERKKYGQKGARKKFQFVKR